MRIVQPIQREQTIIIYRRLYLVHKFLLLEDICGVEKC